MRPSDRVAGIALLVVAATLAYGHLLASDRVLYSRHSDIVAYHFGAKQVLFRAVQSGEGLPFWRSDQLSGTPALTNPNSMYTYPFHFPFLLMPPARAVGWVVWMHAALTAIGFLLLGEMLGLGKWPSLLMGVAGLFNFKNIIATYAGWILPSLFLLPWIFLSVFAVLRRPDARSGLLAAVVAAVALHAGHLQLVYYSLLFLVGLVLVDALTAFRARRLRSFTPTVLWLTTAGLLAAGLSAYLLVPMLAEARLVSRTAASYDFLQAGHRLGPLHLLTFIDPEALGTPSAGTYYRTELWEDVGYFGIVPLVLAGVGAFMGRNAPYTKYFVGCFVISILCALDTPVARVLYAAMPGFSLFRIPARMLYMAAFFGIVLAGIGANQLLFQAVPSRRSPAVMVVLAAMTVIAGEGVFRVHRYLTTAPADLVMPAPDFVDVLRKDPETFRTLAIRPTVNSGWAAAFGLQLIGGYDPYNLTHYGAFLDLVRDGQLGQPRAWVRAEIETVARRDALDVLNVKYVVSPAAIDQTWANLEMVARLPEQPIFVFYQGLGTQDVYVYRNTSYRPRAFLAEQVIAVSPQDTPARVATVDLRRTAVIEGQAEESVESAGSAGDAAHVERASNGRLVINTVTAARRFLVLSEIYHPGWRARLDGQSLPLRRTDHALLGAWIPPGRHRIDLSFRPVFWSGSLSVSICSAAALVLWAAVSLWQKRGAAEPGRPAEGAHAR